MRQVKCFFCEFCVAVWKHWETRFGTTFSVMLAVVQYLYLALADPSRVPKWARDFPPPLWLVIGLVLLFWSCYAAWHEKNKELTQLQDELTAPVIGGELQLLIAGDSNGRLFLIVGGFITNPHGPQSALYDWALRINFPDGTQVRANLYPKPSDQGVTLNQHTTLLTPMFFPTVTVHPIQPGAVVNGWFWGVFNDLTEKEVHDRKASVYLVFRDAISGREQFLQKDFKNPEKTFMTEADREWLGKLPHG